MMMIISADNESTEEEEEDDDNDTTLQEMDSDNTESSSPGTDQVLPSMNQPKHGSNVLGKTSPLQQLLLILPNRNIKKVLHLQLFYCSFPSIDPSLPTSVPTLTSPDEFDDQEAWGEIKAQTNPNDTDSDDDSDDTDVTISNVFPLNTSLKTIVPQPRDPINPSDDFQQMSSPGDKSDVMSTPPTSALVSKLFPKVETKGKGSDTTYDVI